MEASHVADREPALVGRDRELSLLRRRAVEAADSRGGVVLVAGEPGIGKSRLAEEAARWAGARGFRVVWGRCRETEGAPPFWPWTQVLRGVLAGSAADVPAVLRPLLDARPKASGGADRFPLFDAVERLLVEQAGRQPLLIVLDDLHRADHSSLLLLDFLAPSLRDSRLLLTGTFRDTEVAPPHPLLRTIGERAGGVGMDLLVLGGLTAQDTARFVAEWAPGGSRWRPEELRRRCGGNPFFLTELVRLSPRAGESVPATVGAAISARVRRLPGPTRRVLTLAAVLGREFRPRLVAELDGAPVEETEARFGPAVVDGLVRPAADGSYVFVHVLVRDVLYDAIPPPRRPVLHDLVVRVLESPGADGEAAPSDLASHAVRTVRTPQERQRAVRLAGRAAGAAHDRLAHEEAATWFARAVEVGPGSAAERFPLLMGLGGCAGRAAQVDRARSAFEQAWTLAAARGWNHRFAEVALGLGEVVDSAGTIDAGLVRMLERSMDRADPADRPTRIRLHARLAIAIYWGPRLPEARRLASDAVASARRLGDGRSIAVALSAQQFVLRGPDHLSQRLRLGRELVGQARALRDEPMELQARRLLLADCVQSDPVAADVEFQALEALARETGRPLARWYVMINEAMRASLGDDPARAMTIVDRTEAFGHRIGARPAGMYGVAQRWFLRRESGTGAESEDELRAVILEYPRLATLRCALAVLLAEAGRRDEAGALLADLVADDCRAVPPDALWLSSLALLAIAAARLHRPDEAAILHRMLAPHAGQLVLQGLVVWWGAVDHYLGLTAATLGRWTQAEQSFRAALRRHEAWAAAPLVRASRDGLATVLRSRTAPGGGPDPAPRGDTDLTVREHQVLRLLSAGALNKEIARGLGISVHTVERHVANVYTKIGARNRAEATAFALHLPASTWFP